ncbi:OLC1v1007019C1 [Oldenlandia corymbosa var. corymbosa]|uniref:OLC1v1007019C1 n=1 Tax=Oldenlandia corymbosa var. corymbosa TaxID=529605 RepID=A0AAV1DLP9_OLDCO|nr:OLC1v1007019C1 [Oldenlandia corymbosa var. corymbosa]
MSQAIHFMASGFPGLGPPDSQCLPCREVLGSAVCASPYPSRSQSNNSLKLNHSRCNTRNPSLICRASSGGHRRNSDFSRQNKQGSFRKRNWQNEDRDGYDNLEESDMLSSRNGPLLSASGNSRFQATATPGPREKEIVELFRKVQAKLRQRAAVKDEKKTEESQKKGKESETVDSLLKLLRKHSIQQGKVSSDISISNSSEFILDQPVQNGLISDERSNTTFDSNSSVTHVKQESEAPIISRPRSSFQRRSPIPPVEVQPVFSGENSKQSVTRANSEKKMETTLEPLFDVEPEADPPFSEEDEFDEISEDEISGIYDDVDDEVDDGSGIEDDEDDDNETDDVPEPIAAEESNLSEMKLTELRALAKSKGLKGFSKLKKQELIDLLVGV